MKPFKSFDEEPKVQKTKKIVFDLKQNIVFECDDYALINKPPHISSTEERTNDKLLNIKTLAREIWEDPQLCHRLDKETSGILLIAKNPAAYRHFSMQFENRQVTKRYHAVVNGCHDFDGVVVNLPIEKLSNGTAVRIDKAKGKLAETVFYTHKIYKQFSLIECLPITGRMHQIRIHLACLKAPIVCDPAYGGSDVFLSQMKRKFNLKKDTAEEPLIKRVALHAYSLTVKDLNGTEHTYAAPYPKDFDVLVKQLEKFG